jgi:2-polyprenyl-6-methoxyphenol hydroxylase-like FAD-dependent oxidoreductase
LLLVQAGWSVVLIEGQAFPRRKVCGEYLSATNWPLFAELGIADQFHELGGPPVRETAIYSGRRLVRAPLPLPPAGEMWGRGLSRKVLDMMLLAEARLRGAQVFQPAHCTHLEQHEGGFATSLESNWGGKTIDIQARVVIAAHGSWDLGALPTMRQPRAPQDSDWLAFKAHFLYSGLPEGLMPLVSFADGYGGMVHCNDDLASLSCCIRRGRLARLGRPAGMAAGEAVLGHILDSCPALRPVLDSAQLDSPWLAAGPIQPGIRRRYAAGVFVIGNAAGEAHPVVAEGISMAMQSAWLLARRLIPERERLHERLCRDAVGRAYAADWRRAFAGRIRVAASVAQWASRPRLVGALLPAFAACPSLLSWGARLSGKAKLVAAT